MYFALLQLGRESTDRSEQVTYKIDIYEEFAYSENWTFAHYPYSISMPDLKCLINLFFNNGRLAGAFMMEEAYFIPYQNL